MTAGDDARSRLLVERGMGIAAPYRTTEGVIGAFVFGSASRPYADERSDVDVQIVVENGSPLAKVTDRLDSRQTDGTARVADVWFIATSELERLLGLRADMHRRRVSKAVVLFDTGDTIARLVARAAEMPESVRAEAMRVHHAEVTALARSIVSAETRGKTAALHLLATTLVTAAGNLLFYARHEWPIATSWMFEELAIAGVPSDILEDLRALCTAPSAAVARRLGDSVDAYLASRGVDESGSADAAARIAARERFGGEATRLDFLDEDDCISAVARPERAE